MLFYSTERCYPSTKTFLLWKFGTNESFNKLHSSDINFQDFMNLYTKCTEKLYSLLVNYTQIILYVSGAILHKNIETNHDN